MRDGQWGMAKPGRSEQEMLKLLSTALRRINTWILGLVMGCVTEMLRDKGIKIHLVLPLPQSLLWPPEHCPASEEYSLFVAWPGNSKRDPVKKDTRKKEWQGVGVCVCVCVYTILQHFLWRLSISSVLHILMAFYLLWVRSAQPVRVINFLSKIFNTNIFSLIFSQKHSCLPCSWRSQGQLNQLHLNT